MKKNKKIVVGITHGDINGIGYEVIMKTFADARMFELCTPIIYGSPKVAAYHKKVLEFNDFAFNQIRTPREADQRKVNIVNCSDDNIRVELGKNTDEAGEAAYLALEQSVKDLKLGLIDVLVTAPLNKENIQSEKFNFPGHTEFLAREFESNNYLMLLITENLKVGVVAGHVPVNQIATEITEKNILSKLRVLNQSLKVDFGKTNPRIAVLGLNPHAGDNGVIGNEEIEIIRPTIEKANKEGITALGPFPADGFFGSGNYVKFDAILAMYHDQGLAPFKALTFDSGVNFTAGLPIIRTSPGHGTAFEIAGQNKASEESLRQAVYFAIDIYRNKDRHEEAAKNPLPKYEVNSHGESEDVNLMGSGDES